MIRDHEKRRALGRDASDRMAMASVSSQLKAGNPIETRNEDLSVFIGAWPESSTSTKLASRNDATFSLHRGRITREDSQKLNQ